jgi:hypothetical protein
VSDVRTRSRRDGRNERQPSPNRVRLRDLCRAVCDARTSTVEDELVEGLRREFVEPQRPLVTMALAQELEDGGLHDTAEIARLYAIDRPRWWHRFTGRPRS